MRSGNTFLYFFVVVVFVLIWPLRNIIIAFSIWSSRKNTNCWPLCIWHSSKIGHKTNCRIDFEHSGQYMHSFPFLKIKNKLKKNSQFYDDIFHLFLFVCCLVFFFDFSLYVDFRGRNAKVKLSNWTNLHTKHINKESSSGLLGHTIFSISFLSHKLLSVSFWI